MQQLHVLFVRCILHLFSASAFDLEFSPSVAIERKKGNGNQAAAADLYGTVIRVAMYLQTIGMLMSLVSDEEPKFKFAAATTSIAVLLF